MSSAEPPSSLQETRQSDYNKFKRYAAWTFVVGSPVLIALPPRRFDLNTAALTTAFAVSVNHLYKDHNPYGRGFVADMGMKYFGHDPGLTTSTASSSSGGGDGASSNSSGISNLFNSLPTEKAAQVQAQLRAAKEAEILRTSQNKEELEKYQTAKRFEERSLPEKIWMGSETENWKEKRLREEQKALDEGKGYGDLIMDHIWEVWNWGKPGDQKTKKEDDLIGKGKEE